MKKLNNTDKLLLIFYDNWCPYCTRFARMVKRLDWLKRTKNIQLREENTKDQYPLIDAKIAVNRIATLQADRFAYGYSSMCRIALCIPLFWIFVPLLYMLKLLKLGDYFYDKIASNRTIIKLHCDTETNCTVCCK